MPPVAITGKPVGWTPTTVTGVGMPQSRNTWPKRWLAAAPWASARKPSTAAKLVPPTPPTSRAATPNSFSRSAVASDRPAPVSLAISGTHTCSTTRWIAAAQPRACRSPSGCTLSCKKFRWTASASAPIMSIAAVTSSRLSGGVPPCAINCGAPMLPMRNAAGAWSRTTVYV
jgi:hypothetical protein